MNFINLVAGGNGVDADTYQTASFTIESGHICLVAIATSHATLEPSIPDLTGHGKLWSMQEDVYYDQSGVAYRLTVFSSSATSTDSTGVLTITYDVAQSGCAWIVDQATVTHVENNVIVEVVRSTHASASATSVEIGLTGVDEDNGSWACVSWVAQESGNVAGAWEILAQTGHGSPNVSLMSVGGRDETFNNATFSWTTSAPHGAIIVEIYGVTPQVLHALPDDWNLRADADTERSEGMVFAFDYYLTDELGNYLTDEAGNRLVGHFEETTYPQVLHAVQDDWKLNTE